MIPTVPPLMDHKQVRQTLEDYADRLAGEQAGERSRPPVQCAPGERGSGEEPVLRRAS